MSISGTNPTQNLGKKKEKKSTLLKNSFHYQKKKFPLFSFLFHQFAHVQFTSMFIWIIYALRVCDTKLKGPTCRAPLLQWAHKLQQPDKKGIRLAPQYPILFCHGVHLQHSALTFPQRLKMCGPPNFDGPIKPDPHRWIR